MTATGRPTGKAQRRDRAALAKLWGLLYRALRRTTARVEQHQQALGEHRRALALVELDVGNLGEQSSSTAETVTVLLSRVDDLTRQYLWLRRRLEDAGLVERGEGLP